MFSSRLSRHRWRYGLYGVLLMALTAAPVAADQWNERTVMKFASPIMVPGATLQPGTYVFRLVDPNTSRHTVEILRQDTGERITTFHAVPMKRQDATGDIVVKFNPTDAGTPPAMKGWFYPGSLYGHEFVYSDEEARKIAQRTKTVVLSGDVTGSDMQTGTLKVYDANGISRGWTPDDAAIASWQAWQKNRRTTATAVTPAASGEQAKATAPVIDADFQGRRLRVDALEDNPAMYIGKTVSVDAEVEDVYGPRVFTIDEPNWGDLEGELLVYVPSPLAAIVREDDRVTVTGQVKRFVEVKADVENEWGWLGGEEEIEIKLGKRPVLVASKVVGGNNQLALLVDVDQHRASKGDRASGATGTSRGGKATPTGTSGGAGSMAPVTDASTLGMADVDMVGRTVDLRNVRVEALGEQHGLFVRAGDRTVYILPAVGERPGVTKGQTISVEGTVLQMPKFRKDRLQKDAGVTTFNDDIYVYATNIRR